MRISFSSLAAHGHIYPMLPLAVAARNAGHEVTFATPAAFHQTLGSLGFKTVAAGMTFRDAWIAVNSRAAANGSLSDLKGRLFGYEFPKAFAQDLGEWLTGYRPDLFVYGAGNAGAFLAAKRAGVPGVCHGFGRVPTEREMLNDPLASSARAGLTACAAELGVALPESWRPGYGDPYLDVCPPSLQARDFVATKNRLLLRPEPVEDPADLPAWVVERRSERPLVYLTFGTASGQVDLLRQAIDGVAALDVELLVTAGPSIAIEGIGHVPRNVRVEPWVPQAKLMPHVDVVVHHGGGGTALGAFHCGLPQLLLPPGPTYVANAEVIRAVGAGEYISREKVSPEAVAIATKRLLDHSTYREAAQVIRAEIADMPSSVDVLSTLTASLPRC